MFASISMFVIIVTLYVISWFRCRSQRSRNPRLPPVYPGALPIIGNAHLFIGDTIHMWKMIKKTAHNSLASGGVIKIPIGTWNIYALTDPEDCYQVGSTCLHKDAVYDMAKPWLGDGLVTADVHTWKRHRKLVNPAFSQSVLDGYISVFNTQSRRLVDSLAKEVGRGPFDHAPYLEKTTLEIICLTAMGIDDDSVLQNTFYMEAVSQIFHIFVKRFQSLWMQNDFLYNWSFVKKKQDRLVKVLHEMSNTIIQKRKSALTNGKNDPETTTKRFKSFLDRLLESAVDGSMSDSEIREEVDTMISAGFDTSATLLTTAMVLIGSYSEVQENIYEELNEVLEGSDRDIDKYDLPKLVYLEATLKECLRLYPVVPVTARYLDRDVELKNYTLSAGSTCFFVMYGIHQHPVWGPDAEEFRPERLLKDDVPVNAFAGFGLGRRTCIGQKFALMSTKTTLAHVLRRYRVFADHRKMVLKMDIMLKPESGHHISIERR